MKRPYVTISILIVFIVLLVACGVDKVMGSDNSCAFVFDTDTGPLVTGKVLRCNDGHRIIYIYEGIDLEIVQ